MASFAQTFKKPSYLFGSITILLYFMSWGIWWSFFQIWLTSDAGGLKLNGAQVGTVYSVNSAVALVLMLAYGMIQDRLNLKRTLMIVVAAVMSLIGPFAIFVYHPLLASSFGLGVVLGAIFLGVGFIGSTGLFEAFVEKIARRYEFEFGQARAWGSFGYAIVALIAGFLFTINPNINFWVGSALGLMLLLVQLFWPTPEPPAGAASLEEQHTPSFGEMVGVLKNPAVWAVIVFILLSWTFYQVFDQQMFPQFYTMMFQTQEAGQQAYGVLNSVQVFLEAIMMGVVPLLMRRIGPRNTLLLGVTVMFIRIGGCAVLQGPIAISGIKLLHAFEVPLFVLGIFAYLGVHFRNELSATLYLVTFNVAAQIVA